MSHKAGFTLIEAARGAGGHQCPRNDRDPAQHGHLFGNTYAGTDLTTLKNFGFRQSANLDDAIGTVNQDRILADRELDRRHGYLDLRLHDGSDCGGKLIRHAALDFVQRKASAFMPSWESYAC